MMDIYVFEAACRKSICSYHEDQIRCGVGSSNQRAGASHGDYEMTDFFNRLWQ